jgi:hypothetical protein
MIIYLNDPKMSTKRLLDIMDMFSKVAGYKISIQKSVLFLYTDNEHPEKDRQKTISFTIASKN